MSCYVKPIQCKELYEKLTRMTSTLTHSHAGFRIVRGLNLTALERCPWLLYFAPWGLNLHKEFKINRFLGKNILITGASSGIGQDIAMEFGKLGANLYLIARDSQKLQNASAKLQEKNPGITIKVFSSDVSHPEKIQKTIQEIADREGGIHTLINNAGILGLGLFESNTLENFKKVMETNYFGAVYATQAAWPYIKKSTNGHIGFVSSVAGYSGLIGYSTYSPTKFALTGFAECLRMEARDYGIGVTIVFPPDTKTPMLEYEQIHTLPECKALSKNAKVMTSSAVAQKFVQAIVQRQFEVVCNIESKIVRIMRVLCPGVYFKMVDGIVDKDRKKRNKK
ncbi:MAG: SDR family oxidoreductase [Candidatus Brocadiae bacterium]|nr:SDR family oxidoreductase [Candidatus Brocadiia bacterium]